MSPLHLSLREKTVLVVGGAGYIGSHMVRALVEDGFRDVVVFDNLSTGHRWSVPEGVDFVEGDLGSASDLETLFAGRRVDTVMHFAASSLVGESVRDPLKYWDNNVSACVRLLRAMGSHGVKKLVFSSTAAVYGEPERTPIEETDRKEPTNPYGQSKLAIERMLGDVSRAGVISYVALRYFNACGAHPSGEIGECHDPETHLIPNILKAASGETDAVSVFGEDYDTPDGTCLRDYVHVGDLVRAHLKALEYLEEGGASDAFNLGNGDGYSVRQVIEAVERVTGRLLRVNVDARRPGDPAKLVASSGKALKVLGWKPEIGIEEIVGNAWAWHSRQRERTPASV